MTAGPKICDVASSNYVGVYGNSEPGIDGSGLFFRNSHVAFREITDGTAQTLAIGERAHVLGEATWVGSVTGALLQPGTNDGIGTYEIEEESTMVLGQAGEHKSPGDPTGEADMFYSLHPGGVNFVFADGHVAFLTQQLDSKIFEAMSTRAAARRLPTSFEEFNARLFAPDVLVWNFFVNGRAGSRRQAGASARGRAAFGSGVRIAEDRREDAAHGQIRECPQSHGQRATSAGNSRQAAGRKDCEVELTLAGEVVEVE